MNLKQDNKKRVFRAITDPEDIDRIRGMLHDKSRDLLLFDLATQTGIGLKKLLNLKVRHLIDLDIGDKIPIEESGNGKYSTIITETIYKTFRKYLEKNDPEPEDFLFKSKKGPRPINLSSASNMINGWFKAAGLPDVHGAISLRKTWEYNRINKSPYSQNNNPIEVSGFFKPIETSTAQEIIFRELSKAIISCRIPPGTRLTTVEISKAFNVSQAPARVALNWLEARGFITAKKKKASIVKELSFMELKEILQIRLILETAAVDFAIDACTSETLDLTESIAGQIEKAQTPEEHDELNTRFHQAIYRDANMPLLQQMILDLCNKISPYIILKSDIITYEPAIEPYHRGIIKGMRNRDRDMVIKNLILDLEKATPLLADILEKGRNQTETESSRRITSFTSLQGDR